MKMKKIWIPALIATAVALIFIAYYFFLSWSHGSGEVRLHRPEGGTGGMRPPGSEGHEAGEGVFKTLGTIAVFLGAASFSWLWFKKKLKSPSMLVRKIGKLFHAVHKVLGWATLVLIAAHGLYFLIAKAGDINIYTGLAGFVILLMIVGYGLLINKVRNKWMRTVHRSLGLLLVPILLLHAGGAAIAAVIASCVVGGLVWLLERNAGVVKPIRGEP
ncbi:hypothetical protein [Paenibacillus sp. HJGM_3]|uniref:hypothetical protein n=1 Tax=Paenibacillus sp. HJGM_3 TaxID=3379816 RepID=UPI00385D0947